MDHYNYCAQALEHQQKGLKMNDYYLLYVYLKDCPKWIDYDEQDKTDQEGHVARPIGKKAAIKKQKQEELVVSTVEEVLEKIKKEESPHTSMANVFYPTYSSEDDYNNHMGALLKQANEQHQVLRYVFWHALFYVSFYDVFFSSESCNIQYRNEKQNNAQNIHFLKCNNNNCTTRTG
jgi:tetrahydromethanopterin S-methyltransferase subunit B